LILEQNIGTETVTYINHYLKGGQIMSIPHVEFDANAIRLERIFDNTEKMGYVNDGLVCEKVNNVYGKLMFGEVPEDRPITYASYVMMVKLHSKIMKLDR